MLSWRTSRRLGAFALVLCLALGGLVLADDTEPAAVSGSGVPSAGPSVKPSTATPSEPAPGPTPEPSQAPAPRPTVKTRQSAVPAPRDGAADHVVASLPKTRTKSFGMIGVTWSAATTERDIQVKVRTLHHSTWSSWQALELDDEQPGEGGRPGTEGIWVGKAEGIAVDVTSVSGVKPTDIKVVTIDPGTSAADAHLTMNAAPAAASVAVTPAVYSGPADGVARVSPALASSVPPQPAIISRSTWGASAGTTCSSPTTAPTTRGVVVHHTAGSNSYTKSDSAKIVRAAQAYHINGHGWCDIGYNFLVDKYGQIFEGRRGGITKQVRAAHSGNNEVNINSMGVSMMGNFDVAVPSPALKDSTVKLISWRMGQAGLKAKGTYHVNEGNLTLNLIAGHRNVVGTACPGRYAYAWLSEKGGLRDRVETALAGARAQAVPVPKTVTGVKVAAYPSSARITWTAVSGARTYGLCLMTSGTATSCARSLSGLTTTSTTITGLKPTTGTDYYVKVRAGNSAGAGAWSSKIAFNLTSPTTGNAVTVPSSRRITVTGHGYGHGIGMSQYGAQSAAKKGQSAGTILARYYPGTTIAKRTGSIRVLISQDTTDSVIVAGRSGIVFRDVTARKTIKLPSTVSGRTVTRWRIVQSTDKRVSALQYKTSGSYATYRSTRWIGDGQFEGPSYLTLMMPDGSAQKYRGTIRSALPSKGSTARSTVNVLPIESYVRGVVAAEMPASWMPEALQAQAIAARTYGVRSITGSRYYDICNTTACQVYGGVARETTATNAAIAATNAKIVTYKGAPALTQFSSSSGGYTATGSQPYLKAVADSYDDWSGNPNHDWKLTVAASTIERANSSIGTLKQLKITRRSGVGDWGGRVATITLIGSRKTVTISGDEARWDLGLKSNWFRF